MKNIISVFLLVFIVFMCCTGFVDTSTTNTYQGTIVGQGNLSGQICTYYLSDYSGICKGADNTLWNGGEDKIGAFKTISGVELPFKLVSCSSSVLVPTGIDGSTTLYNIVITDVPAVHTADTVLLVFIAVSLLLIIFLFVIGRGVIL